MFIDTLCAITNPAASVAFVAAKREELRKRIRKIRDPKKLYRLRQNISETAAMHPAASVLIHEVIYAAERQRMLEDKLFKAQLEKYESLEDWHKL